MTFFRIFKCVGYGLTAVPFLLLCAASILLTSGQSPAAERAPADEAYVAGLIDRAARERLHEDPYWHAILHYKKGVFGFTSLVDDPAFFFAKDGKHDPSEELKETIRAFFREPIEGTIHPAAKYPARLKWLSDKLEIDPAALPFDGEARFREFYKEVNPSRIILVFPAGFMNSPASMFGHTLLVIESGGGNRLIARAANYAALTDETFGPIFAFRGLFGLYKGYFSFLPYYQKIREYGDGEMRDMWEYELDMSPRDMELMLRHIVEMEDISSEYYFIDENCSYNLLYLVEAARPETRLTDAFGIGVEPIDTLRVARDRGLVRSLAYRPSLYSKINHLRAKLTAPHSDLALAICKGGAPVSSLDGIPASEEEKIIICDLSADYLKFMAIKGSLTEQEYRERFLAVLQKRNSYATLDTTVDIRVPSKPEESHGSRRIGFESGMARSGAYSAISYRQTCHELMDPDEGYNRNSQIVFGNVSGRYYYEDKLFLLQGFDIINLTSLPASDSYFFGACYDFRTGLERNLWHDGKEYLSYRVKGATGLSTLLGSHFQTYAFAGVRSWFAPVYDHGTDLELGGEWGLFTWLGPWKSHLFAQYYRAPVGYSHTALTAGASERLKITNAYSLVAEYRYNSIFSFQFHELSLRLNYYY
ncbi:MAG: DUF4105 domain-containing protein [Spirochaetes bacterium]|nr:MAG: DUF4105 domain-containing protein [Spirochaetota bacterium]